MMMMIIFSFFIFFAGSLLSAMIPVSHSKCQHSLYYLLNRIEFNTFTAQCGSRAVDRPTLVGWCKRRLNKVLVSFCLVTVHICSIFRGFLSFFSC